MLNNIINNITIPTDTTTDCNTNNDDTETTELIPVPFNYILILLLVCLSALFSGLTLGLLGLDVVGLEIIIGGDNESVKKAARDILPIRKRGNLLLCTLLLGNVATNSLLSILMANMTSGLIGFFTSTILIVLFGEIIPQATCSRHALFIGQKSLPLVKFFLGVFFVVAYPLSVVLDYFLGEEIGTIHSRQELIAMLKIHHRHEQLDQDTVNVMSGAIQYRDKKAEDVMTPISDAFMLSSADKLNSKTMSEIFKSGYSRIPVYGESRNDIVGLMLTKDMIFIDPEDEVPIVNFMNLFHRPFQMVWNDDKLGEVLKGLKQGHSHLAFVRGIKENGLKDNTYEIVGIITLEDVIEEILGQEIEDETDELPESKQIGTRDRELARLILLTGRNSNTKLSLEEIQVISLHLTSNIPQFKNLIESNPNSDPNHSNEVNEKIMKMLSICKVMEITRQSNYDEITKNKPVQEDIIYKKGKATNTAALILNGKVSVLAGKEQFYSELGSWSIIGMDGLSFNKKTEPYVPDFTAYVSSEKVRILWITQTDINSLFDQNSDGSLKDDKKKRKTTTTTISTSNSTIGQNSSVNPLHQNFQEYEMSYQSQETKSSIKNGLGGSKYESVNTNNNNNNANDNGSSNKSGSNRLYTRLGNQYESLDDNV